MESLEFFSGGKSNCFKDQNIIVTGGTGGIGSIVVETLIKLGAKVCIISRSERKVLGTFKTSSNYFYEILNLEEPLSINRGFTNIIKRFGGRLNSVISCHGMFKVGRLSDTNIDQFDTAININVRSNFHLISLSAPFLKLSKGNVVLVSSVESKVIVNDSFLNSLSKVIIYS